MRARFYIDGFNLYYGCLKGTPNKWLDLGSFASKLAKGHSVDHIHYFTARAKDALGHAGQAARQAAYLRALKTVPNLSIHEGQFLSKTVNRMLAHPARNAPRFVDVIVCEEKGSDVNLASWLLLDAHMDKFDVAFVITNDSDLATPVRMVRDNFAKKVFVRTPRDRYSHELSQVSTHCDPIRTGIITSSQFPSSMTDAKGTFQKPTEWGP